MTLLGGTAAQSVVPVQNARAINCTLRDGSEFEKQRTLRTCYSVVMHQLAESAVRNRIALNIA
jgi:hypothetical protein